MTEGQHLKTEINKWYLLLVRLLEVMEYSANEFGGSSMI